MESFAASSIRRELRKSPETFQKLLRIVIRSIKHPEHLRPSKVFIEKKSRSSKKD